MSYSEPQILLLTIATEILRPEVVYFKEIDSTNAYLLGDHNHPEGTIVLADYQTAGRGRLGRTWEAPQGEALLFSFFLNVDHTQVQLSNYSLVVALAVRQALQELIPEGAFYLKWPNDILYENKKVCGILVQSRLLSPNSTRVVVGIGINVNQDQNFFRDYPFAGSLYSLTNRKYDRFNILNAVVQKIDDYLHPQIINDSDWIVKNWIKYCPFIGKTISVDDGKRIYVGTFVSIEKNGALRLKTEKGEYIFHAADVTIAKGV